MEWMARRTEPRFWMKSTPRSAAPHKECATMLPISSRRIFRSTLIALGALALATLSGCISQGEYDRVHEAYTACAAEAGQKNARISELEQSLAQLQAGYGKGEGALAALQRENQDLKNQLASAQGDLKGIEGRLGQLSFGPLDRETEQRIDDIVSKFPGLLSFDSARGMVRVNSDLTFDSGSDVVKDQARQGLQALSQVLTSGAATQYDVIVEGHTDSQRMANSTTIQRHRTNRGLSTNRANAVVDVLAGMGIQPTRLMAAGWGEYRPTVPNNPNGNTRENRRVEIYMAKLGGPGATASAPTNPGTTFAIPTADGGK
jgi:chemotaxis protein MotB